MLILNILHELQQVSLRAQVVLLAGLPQPARVESRQCSHASEVVRDGSPANAIVEELFLGGEDVRVEVQVAGDQDECLFADVDVDLALEVALVGVEAPGGKVSSLGGVLCLQAGDNACDDWF